MTSANETSSAASRVFDVAELLESILLYTLEPHTEPGDSDEKVLLLSQRVNTSFRSCILGSPEIQRRLGFRAVHKKGDGWVNKFVFQFHRYHYEGTISIDGLEFFDYGHARHTGNHIIRFGPIDQDRLRKSLATCQSSWLGMYPQQYTGQHVTLGINTCHFWGKSNCHMMVMLRPLRDLIELAMSFMNAAKHFKRIRRDYGWKVDTKEFGWKKFFTEEQVEMIVEEPEFYEQMV